jgi:hypothetical protein
VFTGRSVQQYHSVPRYDGRVHTSIGELQGCAAVAYREGRKWCEILNRLKARLTQKLLSFTHAKDLHSYSRNLTVNVSSYLIRYSPIQIAAQHSTAPIQIAVQHSTAQHSTHSNSSAAQHSTAQRSTAQHSTAPIQISAQHSTHSNISTAQHPFK